MENMKINEIYYGFTVNDKKDVEEIAGTLYCLEHKKSGARLLFLDREDENKTFSITFKTIPEDSTGVFHIIEHSVLNGSEKYTAKEPFVELLKSSLNTFLNAMTFPDKTMYPVASRNDKDFFNLVSVYLDAVFHPAILTQKNIFYQEGWHTEIDEESGELTRTGVVLNEMRGAFSSPDELASYHIQKMLYPDTCYKYESGGDPDEIPNLTYEKFRDTHGKYYHPSNSEIFLDGSVKLDEILPLLDSTLSEYERRENVIEISEQLKIEPQREETEYEIAPGESAENKTRLSVGYMSNRFDEQEKTVALSVLLDAIASSNEAPLKKAIIASGLCEDFDLTPLESIKQNSVTVDFKNVKDGKCEELYTCFTDSVKRIAQCGIDKGMLEASLNSLEFRMREKDFGTLPIGIIYAMSTLEASLYGGDPAQNLSYSKSFESLRRKLKTDYFEKLLIDTFITNTHRATLIMTPSAALGEERTKKERAAMEQLRASLTEDELREIKDLNAGLKEWQKKPDTKEALETIPKLKISDISTEVEKIPQTADSVDGVTVLTHDIATNGILYSDLYFDASDLNAEEIFALRMMLSLIENVRTESRSAIELQNLIKRELGSFSLSMSPLTASDGKAKIYVTVSASSLAEKAESIISLTKEVLYTSVYTDKEVARNILRQMKLATEESFNTGGNTAGFKRASAGVSAEGAIQEYYSGYEALVSMKRLDSDFDSAFPELLNKIHEISERIFVKERMTISITGKPAASFVTSLVSSVKTGKSTAPVCNITPFKRMREGIIIPAQTAFAVTASNLFSVGERLCGSLRVVRTLLSYGYLWNEVRVQGGAYGVGLILRNNGNVGFYSYRDPLPKRTLECYKKASDALREFAESGEDVTKFIIGAIGDTSPLTTPKLKGALATTRYLRGVKYEDECRLRREILETDSAELLRIADIIDKLAESNAVCIVGGKDKLDTCPNLDSVLVL